jgi:NADH pyrophosphatase NudC (nudix superfamily)
LSGLEIASYLYEIKKKGFFKDLSYQSWQEFCVGGVKWSVRKCDYYVSIFEKFCLVLGIKIDILQEIEMSNLREIVPYINEENKEELLGQAKLLSYRDLITELKTKGKSISELMECPHEWEYCLTRFCPKCGAREGRKNKTKIMSEMDNLFNSI